MPDLQNQIDNLKKAGKPNSEIIERLKKEGHPAQEIYDAMENTQKTPNSELAPPTPSEEMGNEAAPIENEEPSEEIPQEKEEFMQSEKFPAPKSIPPRQGIENIEEIAEAIIQEKMEELSVNLTDLNLWKEKTSTETEAIKQEILRIRNQFENLQNALLSKVEDYKKNISTMNIEVKTLSKVMEKIIQPLTMNVKELGRITDRLKK